MTLLEDNCHDKVHELLESLSVIFIVDTFFKLDSDQESFIKRTRMFIVIASLFVMGMQIICTAEQINKNIQAIDYDEHKPLFDALELRNEKKVEEAINQGADVTHKNKKSGKTPLYTAVEAGSLSMVKLLLDRGANVSINDEDEMGQTVLFNAVFRNNPEIVKALLERGADVHHKDSAGQAPILKATTIPVLQVLLHYGANINEKSDDDGPCFPITPLTNTIKPELLKFLIEKGADVNLYAGGTSPMGCAVESGSAEVVTLMLDGGADAHAPSDAYYFITVLHSAALNGFVDSIKLLLEHGADPHALDRHQATPLGCAALSGHLEAITLLAEHADEGELQRAFNGAQQRKDILKFFLEKGARIDKSGHLYEAAERGNCAIVQFLLDNGAFVDSCNRGRVYDDEIYQMLDVKTPLCCALHCLWNEKRHVAEQKKVTALEKTVDLLLKHGACLNAVISYAVRERLTDFCSFVLKKYKQINLNQRDARGDVPLMTALLANNVSLMALLLEHGADANGIVPPYEIPLQLAQNLGHHEIAALLAKQGILVTGTA